MTALFNQAVQAHQSGKLPEAESLYRQIISQDPNNFDALHMLGIVCSGTGKIQEADSFFRTALSIDPGFPPCHVNYGFCLLKQKRFNEAVGSFDKALALFPNFGEAWLGRGNALRELRQYDQAFAAYDRAATLNPRLAEAHAGRGNMLAELKRFDEAITAYDRALASRPELEYVESERLFCKMRLCDWRNFSVEQERVVASVKDKRGYAQPFAFLSLRTSPREQLECAKSWVAKKYPASDTPLWQGDIYKHDKIRIAYVSSDFRQHPTSLLIAGLIEGHNRQRFDLVGISLLPDDGSDIGQRMKGAFEKFIDASALSDEKIATLIRELEVDIAIDLNAHTRNSRTNIFARRAAPVQVSYMGYPGTMGAGYIDYLVADPTVIPIEDASSYSEKIAWLPNVYLATDRKLAIASKTPERTAVGLPDSTFVFCCFNQAYKIQPDVFDCWMRVLKRVDGSVLWLLEDNAMTTGNLRKEAAARNVDPGRLVFAPRIPTPDHLARHKCADLFLDTLPVNAHTTAIDALWAGLPVVTHRGQAFAGRVAASLLTAVGMPELVTSTQATYETLAIELATSPGKLSATKEKLARNRLTMPLFDTPRFIQDIEAAYDAMYRRYQDGLPPDHIRVGH